jgi:signal transduction histidine kinase
MKIRALFIWTGAANILLLALLAFAFQLSEHRLQSKLDEIETIRRLVEELFQLNTLSDECLYQPEQRPREQWQRLYGIIGQRLHTLQQTAGSGRDLVQRLIAVHQRQRTLFSQLLDSLPLAKGIPLRFQGKIQESLRRLFSTASQEMVSLVFKMGQLKGQEIRRLQQQDYWLIALMLIFSGLSLILLVLLLHRSVAQPLGQLGQAVRHVSTRDFLQGSLAGKFPLNEVGELALAFDELRGRLRLTYQELTQEIQERKRIEAEREQLEQQFIQAQKMEAIGRLASGIAHDFNNLLTVITGHTSLGLAAMEEEHPLRESLQEIEKAAERATTLIRQLLAFSRKQVLAPQTINLVELMDNLQDMLARVVGAEIQLVTTVKEGTSNVQVDCL